MNQDQIILTVVGSILIVLGATGVMNHTRKGKRWANLIGPVPARLLYIVLGITAIALSFILL